MDDERGGSSQAWISAFGNRIDHVPGHFALFEELGIYTDEQPPDIEDASTNVAGGHEALDYDVAATRLSEDAPSITLSGYAIRLMRVARFLDLLATTNERPHFGTMLDLGTGRGIQPRILRGLGVVDRAVGVDLYDRATGIDERRLARLHGRLWMLRLIERRQLRALRTPSERRTPFERYLLQVPALATPRTVALKTGYAASPKSIYRPLKARPTLDEYVNGNVYEHQGQYDLVTSFSSLEWFDHTKILPQVSALLRPGGLFYLWVPNWWAPLNPTHVGGDFPYASQRLGAEDYFAYLREQLPPAHAAAFAMRYRYFDPTHPTLDDYVNTAFEHQMVPIAYGPDVVPFEGSADFGVSAAGYMRHAFGEVGAVLRDVRHFRPDVNVFDLLPYTHCLIFKKVEERGDMEGFVALQRDSLGEVDFAPAWLRRAGGAVLRRLGVTK